MKLTYIGIQDLVGHKFNGFDLCREMRRRGIDARFYVLIKKSSESWVRPICGPIGLALFKLFNRFEYMTGLQSILSPMVLLLLARKHIRQSEVIHFQMVQFSYFPIWMVGFFARKKNVFWTLHDPWPLTGHCIHPAISDCGGWQNGCLRCPNLSAHFPIPFDSARWNYLLKLCAFRDANLHIIVASDYMESLVARSRIFRNASVTKIPFGVDAQLFRKRDRMRTRGELGIPENSFTIMFRSSRSEFKGLGLIKAALAYLNGTGISLITLDEKSALGEVGKKFTMRELGWIEDDARLAELYSAADVFLMPSKAESFGMMAIEAMACGTPVIAADNTSLSETVDYGRAGVLVGDDDAERLASEIERLRLDPRHREELSERGLALATARYGLERYNRTMEQCYSEAIKRNEA